MEFENFAEVRDHCLDKLKKLFADLGAQDGHYLVPLAEGDRIILLKYGSTTLNDQSIIKQLVLAMAYLSDSPLNFFIGRKDAYTLVGLYNGKDQDDYEVFEEFYKYLQSKDL